MSTAEFPSTILGYPRIGPNRQIKKALEVFWSSGEPAALQASIAEHRNNTATHLGHKGLSAESGVPLDGAVIDQVLDVVALLGAVPARFKQAGYGPVPADSPEGLSLITALSRGTDSLEPLEMTKWFDTNYHYYVPELQPGAHFTPDVDTVVQRFTELKEATGLTARTTLLGPVSFLLLAKAVAADASSEAPAQAERLGLIDAVTDAYASFIAALGEVGAQWVQLEEPALASDGWDVPRADILAAVRGAYSQLTGVTNRPQLFVPVGYGDAGSDALAALGSTGVEAVGVDLVRSEVPSAEALKPLESRIVVAGVVDGLNIWRAEFEQAAEKLESLKQNHQGPVAVGTSTSLIHVPHDAEREIAAAAIDEKREILSWLAFADQKIAEVLTLEKYLQGGRDAVEGEFADNVAAHRRRREHARVSVPAVKERLAAVTEADRNRAPAQQRREAQDQALGLPELPTTTIGSFPQTQKIRGTRAAFRGGKITEEAYTSAIREEIADCIRRQEALGLDVLVHGEAERNDMVQYFAENLEGFITTTHGWVQSYGSRCLRPPVLFGDVHRPTAITVDWINYAASLTTKQVKGMLTGPVTILAWSFVRDDQPLGDTADQIALALRDEVSDLQANGVQIIQVDEPALRELLPLKVAERDDYVNWSVGAFRLATASAETATQLHTHLCYSEFETVIGAIDALNADVTTVEASRSGFEVVSALHEHGYSRGIGPGIWDIHSPRVPSTEELRERLSQAANGLGKELVWSNPDCGLKTRGWEETEASLRNLVAATAQVRAEIGAREWFTPDHASA